MRPLPTRLSPMGPGQAALLPFCRRHSGAAAPARGGAAAGACRARIEPDDGAGGVDEESGGADAATPAARLAASISSIFDFEAWAPKSSRVWRLQVPPKGFEEAQAKQAAADAAFLEGLNAALAGPGSAAARADARASVSESEDEEEEEEGEEGGRDAAGEEEEEEGASIIPTTSSVDDAALAASLAARLASTSPSPLASAEEEAAAAAASAAAEAAAAPPLTGAELAAGVLAKYERPYDLTIVRRNLAGIRVVALNVMWNYVGQKSLNLSPDAYADKCDALATALTAWGCAPAVREFFKEPARSKRGLPGRPVVGNAVSLRLDVDPDVVAEWMGGQ